METERLQFRQYETNDLEWYISLWAQPEVVRFIGKGVTKSREEAEKSFFEWILPGYAHGKGLHLIVLKETGERIGHAGLVTQTLNGKKETEIGYWLMPPFWGNGYGREAAQFFKDYGKEQLHIQQLICLIQPKNTASIRVAEKIGMRFDSEQLFNGIPVHVYRNQSR